jgi:hypothetical protein
MTEAEIQNGAGVAFEGFLPAPLDIPRSRQKKFGNPNSKPLISLETAKKNRKEKRSPSKITKIDAPRVHPKFSPS